MPERDDSSPTSAHDGPGHELPTHDAPTHDAASRPGELAPSDFYRLAIDAGAPPSQVGPYRLLRRVGEGGMGEVWGGAERAAAAAGGGQAGEAGA